MEPFVHFPFGLGEWVRMTRTCGARIERSGAASQLIVSPPGCVRSPGIDVSLKQSGACCPTRHRLARLSGYLTASRLQLAAGDVEQVHCFESSCPITESR
ncbi:MAG: hypothetical protein DMD87_29855 [Candidatus Rokuibacteriota bacterium]|nr:MAG: hypothetical protein DMD87_29855 [Candidatus Rokubacteria bacterium]